LTWIPAYQASYTTVIAVGTISTLIVTVNDGIVFSTSTLTNYNRYGRSASFDPDFLSTNEEGTTVALAAYTDTSTTTFLEIAYPTSCLTHDEMYSWERVLPTHNEGDSAVCTSLSQEPLEWLPKKDRPTTPISSPGLSDEGIYPMFTQTSVCSPNPDGQEYEPVSISLDIAPGEPSLKAALPSTTAFDYCTSAIATTIANGTSGPKRLLEHATKTTSFWDRTTTLHTPITEISRAFNGRLGERYDNRSLCDHFEHRPQWHSGSK